MFFSDRGSHPTGIPEYLAKHYWWAYLAPRSVWFFDHHLIINFILLGQYRRLLNEVMRHYSTLDRSRTLQLSCAYGSLTPTLALAPNTQELHVIDVASIQLSSAQNKLRAVSRTAQWVRMDAESLAYAPHQFDSVIIFFLLHELPEKARACALSEAIRVLKPGGQLLIAEYGEHHSNLLRFFLSPWCWIQERLEPFLSDFRHQNLTGQLQKQAQTQARQLQLETETLVLGGMFRVIHYRV